MYVKVYSYHVQPDRVAEYIKIQQMAERIYSEYVEKTTLHLNSIEVPTKWTEIHQYANEETYRQSIEIENARSELKELYEAFLNVLIDGTQVTEENYVEIELNK